MSLKSPGKWGLALLLFLFFVPALGAASLLADGWSKLSIFNAFIPQDRGSERLEKNLSFGPHPRQSLDIYRPVGPQWKTSGLPVLVFLYGGSWNSGSKNAYEFVGRAFAATGYLTVIPDYRLVPEVRFPVFLEDSAKAFAWVRKNVARYGGDPNRMFLVGHSAGAYNATMLALDPRFLAAEGVNIKTIKGVAGLSGPYDFLPLQVDSTRAAFADVDDLPATQPINLVTRRAPPIFLAAGDEDNLVKPRNSQALGARLRLAGRPHETRIYSGVDHAGTLLAISRPFRSKAPVILDIVNFFNAHSPPA